MVFEEERLWVEHGRVFAKKQLLNFDELDV